MLAVDDDTGPLYGVGILALLLNRPLGFVVRILTAFVVLDAVAFVATVRYWRASSESLWHAAAPASTNTWNGRYASRRSGVELLGRKLPSLAFRA